MADSVGIMSQAVLKKDTNMSAWGEQHAKAALASGQAGAHAVPIMSENITEQIARDEAKILSARSSVKQGEIVQNDVSGEIVTPILFNNLDPLFCAALGFENPNTSGASFHGSPELVSGAYYRHIYEMDEHLEREVWLTGEITDYSPATTEKVRSFGFMVTKQVSSGDFIADNFMPNSMSLRAGVRDGSITFGGNAKTRRIGDFSSAITLPALLAPKLAVFPHLTVSIGSTDDLTDPYAGVYPYAAISVAEISLTMNNALKVDDRGTATGLYIMEPLRNGFATVEGSITLPRYSSNAVLDRFAAGTAMCMRIGFANGSYALDFLLPLVIFTEEDHTTGGPEVRQPKFSFRAYKPADLTDATNPFKASNVWNTLLANISLIKNNSLVIRTVNTKATNYLTEN